MLPNHVLREARQQRGLAQRALSIESGVSCTTINAIEKYGLVPGKDIRARIAAVLDLDVEQIWPSERVAVA